MFDERSPINRQIAERIRSEVLSGALGEDEQAMSTTQYATHFRINPATAAKAFAELVDQGVLYKVPRDVHLQQPSLEDAFPALTDDTAASRAA